MILSSQIASLTGLLKELPGIGDVHIWFIPLEDAQPEYMQLLDDWEKKRASRFRYNADSRRFINAHGALRCILAVYLGVNPKSIHYTYNPYGKPVFASDTHNGLCFNLSHSGSIGAVAITRYMDVGIDIEQISGLIPFDELMPHVLSPFELLDFREKSLTVESFFKLWTRKEAYLKATGKGLNMSPCDAPSFGLQEMKCHGQNNQGCWSIVNLEPAPGYVGAVAALGNIVCVKNLTSALANSV
jgi:4'-phosphopantetheinyl transferase